MNENVAINAYQLYKEAAETEENQLNNWHAIPEWEKEYTIFIMQKRTGGMTAEDADTEWKGIHSDWSVGDYAREAKTHPLLQDNTQRLAIYQSASLDV